MAADDRLLGQIEALYCADAARFYRVALAVVRDPDLAWDSVQEGFVDAVRASTGFRGDAPLEVWVWRLVVNAARRSYRQPRFQPIPPEHEQATAASGDGPVMIDAVAALPERQRLVVFLRYYADLDYQTIAQIAGVEVGTVSATLHAALATLRRRMEVPQ